jgi:hydroxymethylglutaryl-CoA reductase
MKMHLLNILNQLNATKEQIEKAKLYFVNNTVSFSNVREFLQAGPLQ